MKRDSLGILPIMHERHLKLAFRNLKRIMVRNGKGIKTLLNIIVVGRKIQKRKIFATG